MAGAGWSIAWLAMCAAALSGCSSGQQSGSATSASSAPSGPAGACGVVVSDAWVKAADSGMTAAFGVITNPGGDEVVITGATSAAAGRIEIHEMAEQDGKMVMRPKEGGLPVPAAASATLAPGGDHLMLMDIPAPISAGDEVLITMMCAQGSQTFTAQAKTFAGAAEQYQPSASPAE